MPALVARSLACTILSRRRKRLASIAHGQFRPRRTAEVSGEFLCDVARQLDRDLVPPRRRQIHVDEKLGQSRQAGILHNRQIVWDLAAQERA